MKRKVLVFFCTIVVLVIFSIPAIAEEDIYKDNPFYLVMVKVQEAADYLSKNGEDGLAEFNKEDGKFTWGQGKYVFVYNCEEGLIVGHPAPARIGGKISERVDGKGYYYGADLCTAANKPKGGWVEYYRRTDTADKTTGGEMYKRKVTYILKVPGKPYEVGAGMYEPNKTVDELNELLKKVKFY